MYIQSYNYILFSFVLQSHSNITILTQPRPVASEVNFQLDVNLVIIQYINKGGMINYPTSRVRV